MIPNWQHHSKKEKKRTLKPQALGAARKNLNEEQNITLYNICKCHSIFLWEDRKFNDISNTVIKQLKKYENVRDFVSICPTSGPDLLKIKSKLGFFVLIEI